MTDVPADERPMTKADVAAWFGKNVRTIERWMRDGVLPYMKLGKKKSSPVYFDRAQVVAHLKQRYGH